MVLRRFCEQSHGDLPTLKHKEVIATSKKLAAKLAELATRIRNRVNGVLLSESGQGLMQQLFKACQEILIRDLSEDRFADMFAQTIAYGLFSARCSRRSGEIVAENLKDMIPETNLFSRELLSTLFSIGGRKRKIDFDELGINDVVEMLRNTDIDAVLLDFGDKNPSEDPVIHFYEDFLKQYDVRQKIRRGAFYTPKPAVSFIVRSVHEILKNDFGLEYGLADTATWGEMAERSQAGAWERDILIPERISKDAPFVQILDPAVGTGTFLVEVIDLIHKTMAEKWENEGENVKEFWNDYVPKHLLPRLYGFELMMAPYSVAHVKIALKLIETGYQFKMTENEVIRIYLTDSLEPAKDMLPDYLENFSPALAHEAMAANRVKQSVPVTVVIGNPPYSGHSANKGEWISSLLRKNLKDGAGSYFEVDGESLNERNPKWLNDDYVKFIRYAQYQLAVTGTGLLGFITNHSYIDNPTFRGMRQSLMKSFSKIYIADLHGNAKKKEKCPDGSKDENVFDIQQGVAVGFFLKKKVGKEISHADFWRLRDVKYETLLNNNINSVDWNQIYPQSSFYLFMPQERGLLKEYEQCRKVTDIMPGNSVGIVTGQDSKTIGFTLHETMDLAKSHHLSEEAIQPILYRPFDVRFIVYDKRVVTRVRQEVMRNMLAGKNIGIITIRRSRSSDSWKYAFITNKMTAGATSVTSLDINYLFPLYFYPDDKKIEIETSVNFEQGFKKLVNSLYDFQPVPEQILGYIYAVLHSPEYRRRYAEFLKIDFPRIPFTRSRDLFEALSRLGSELVSLHLLESEKLNKSLTTFPVSGDNSVSKVGEKGKSLSNIKDGKGRLYINKTQYFDGIPEAVWHFHIGGYQVCHKWLYDRKQAGRSLSAEDVRHYHRIVAALNETIRIMQEIDEVIEVHGGFPIQ